MSRKKVFPLSRLAAAIEKVINEHCNKIVWIKAEIVKLNYYPQTGHCFPDLVEKRDGRIIAEMRSNIWKSNFEVINQKFREVLNEDLKDDMTVVIQAAVTYHPVYGLALNILDIDPAYTLGELARQKAEAIKKLKQEGIFGSNKNKILNQVPKNIAVISVDSSKGYRDFVNVMETNPWKYVYHHHLFPAVLQGERAVSTIVAQLKKVKKYQKTFDAVAIIRGGGGGIGLSCYDSYELAKAIANFPLPVLTGIGHSTNETVSELVSHRNFITPTKVAEFLLQSYHDFARPLEEAQKRIELGVQLNFERRQAELARQTRSFDYLTHRSLEKNFNLLRQITNNITRESKNVFKSEKTELSNLSAKIDILSPQNVLKRGYSITRANGKAVVNAADLEPGLLLETQYYSGKSFSRTEKTEYKN